jgi:hypothetical protein
MGLNCLLTRDEFKFCIKYFGGLVLKETTINDFVETQTVFRQKITKTVPLNALW